MSTQTAAGQHRPGRLSWFHPTVRVRLTLLYGGMFLFAGSLLVVLLYVTFNNSFPSGRGNSTGLLSQVDRLATQRPTPGVVPPPSQTTGRLNQELLRRALDAQREEALDSLLQQSLIALGLVSASAVGFGWMMAGRVLRPVRDITDTARRVADRHLHERIALQGPRDELKELADTFDAMLERLDAAFESQRRFVANASHELRTPIAINRTLLEVAESRPDVTLELRQLHATLLTSNERSERLLDGLLTLASSENQEVKQRPVDLSDLAAGAVEQTAWEASQAGVVVDATPDPARTAGNPILLERLALNLVQNGIRHNHRGGWVRVRTAPADLPGWVELTVANTGPDVAPHDTEDLFEPFRRLHEGRTGSNHGVGLGLSIVQAVVRTHGGQVSATPRDGGGLIVRVRLPAAPAPSGTAPTRT